MRRGLIALALCTACTQGTIAGDRNGDASRNGDPGAAETSDEGSPGDAATSCLIDVDRDGACAAVDCDDENAAINPDADEVCHNGLDDDCDDDVDEDCLGSSLFYVDKDSIGGTCDNNGPGSETRPWCSMDKANTALQAGQTVLIRAGAYTGEAIEPANTGRSNDLRIIYAAYPGEEVVLTRSNVCVSLEDVAYVTVLGIQCIDCERNLYIRNSQHNNVGYSVFDTPMGPTTWRGSNIIDDSTHNRVFNCTFSRYGEEYLNRGSWDDRSSLLDIGRDQGTPDASDYNLVVNSTFFYGGHHILGVYSNHNIVRGNTFHNEEWYACHRDEINNMCGNRNVVLNTPAPGVNTRNVIEDNTIAFAGVPPDQVSSAGLSLRTQYNIVRKNLFYYSDSAGVTLSVDSAGNNDASNNVIYNNVFYKNGFLLVDDWDPRKYGLMFARWEDTASYARMTDVAVKNNIFHENNLGAIYYYYVDEADQTVADNWEEAGDPRFMLLPSDEPDPFDLAAFDFRLQGTSPCKNNGGFLTTATENGNNSTTLKVDRADYFFDGYGVVAPDLVQLQGQDAAVAIEGVDYENNTLTLAEPLTWTAGTGVSLPYHGDRPDQGAFEYRGAP